MTYSQHHIHITLTLHPHYVDIISISQPHYVDIASTSHPYHITSTVHRHYSDITSTSCTASQCALGTKCDHKCTSHAFISGPYKGCLSSRLRMPHAWHAYVRTAKRWRAGIIQSMCLSSVPLYAAGLYWWIWSCPSYLCTIVGGKGIIEPPIDTTPLLYLHLEPYLLSHAYCFHSIYIYTVVFLIYM